MKNILRFLFYLSFLFTITNLLFAQWIQTTRPDSNSIVNTLAVSDTNLYAGTDLGGIFLSTDNGTSWNQVNTGLTKSNVYTLIFSGKKIFAGTSNGVFLSTNNGISWSSVSSGLTNTNVYTLTLSDTNLFAGTFSGVFLSTNSGTSWSAVNSGLTNTYVSALAVSGTNLFAGTWYGIFLSTDNGTNWTEAGTDLTNIGVYHLAVSGTNFFAGTSGGVFLSTNNGKNWSAVNTDLPNTSVYTFGVYGKDIFAGIGNGFFLSTNNGTTWSDASTGLTNTVILSLAVSGRYLFSGGAGVWRRPLSEMITSVKKFSPGLPVQFILSQNYPNPFNPSTNISFTLPSKGFVSLKIFDALGREVAMLISEELLAGSYTRQWNAANMSSGIYFYRLQAGSFTETKKLVLLK